MARFEPVEFAALHEQRFNRVALDGPDGFGADKIYHRQNIVRIGNVVGIGADIVGKAGKNTYNLTSFGRLQFADAVVGFYNLFGFDIAVRPVADSS